MFSGASLSDYEWKQIQVDTLCPGPLSWQGDVLGNSSPLTLSKTTNFRLFQAERVCRRQF